MLQLHFRHPISGQTQALHCAQLPPAVSAHSLAEVPAAWEQVQAWQAAGYGAVGYISYEAAAAWNPSLPTRAEAGTWPLLHFYQFHETDIKRLSASATAAAETTADSSHWALAPWRSTVNHADYSRVIARIQAAIAAGETYQVNYTLPFESQFTGQPAALYQAMRRAQHAPYAAMLPVGERLLLSASPELFFHWDGPQLGRHIRTQPMKGTRPRGLSSAADAALATALAQSSKDRAENVMIVDLLRNDLGQIAEIGSVQVPQLFQLEAYPSVWQMTSQITATTRPEIGLTELLAALFPCGSITGAPKRQTMQHIQQLESGPRGPYCGSIMLLRPDGSVTASVAIRSLLLDAPNAHGQRPAHYHAGAGITAGSQADDEWQETWAKTRVVSNDFLQQQTQDFELIETLLWTGHEFALLAQHTARLSASAERFAYPLQVAHWQAEMEHCVNAHGRSQVQRVRTLLAADGRIQVSSSPLDALPSHFLEPPASSVGPYQSFALAQQPIHSQTLWLYHKTTQRQLYDAARQTLAPGVWDVLLYNERDEICEFTIGNVVLQIAGQRLTPPLSSGLLPGTLRAELLERGSIQEQVLTLHDLDRAEAIWLINSVRGWVAMQRHWPSAPSPDAAA